MTPTERRAGLLRTARDYTSSRIDAPGAVGMYLYGSLAVSPDEDLTKFSDVDVALIYEDEAPSHFTEHRLHKGVEVDNLLFKLSDFDDFLAGDRRLFARSFIWMVLTALLVGDERVLLHDPQGRLAELRDRVRTETSYSDLARPDLSNWCRNVVDYTIGPAEQALFNGDVGAALSQARDAFSSLKMVVRYWTQRKDLARSCSEIGVPVLAERRSELRSLLYAHFEVFENYREALERLERWVRENAYEAAAERLRAAGREPDATEFVGQYDLFWIGNRLMEFGRLKFDSNSSFERSRYEQAIGNLEDAAGFFRFSDPWHVDHRCRALGKVLDDLGCGEPDWVEDLLASDEYRVAIDDARGTAREWRRVGAGAESAAGVGAALEILREAGALVLAKLEGGAK